MNTLEEIISRVCAHIGINYETIKPEIKYYDFEYPNATNMTAIVDIAQEVGSDTFELWIPPESFVDVNESSWSHYTDYYSVLYLDGTVINYNDWHGERIEYGYSSVSSDYLHQILVENRGGSQSSGVGWVLIYTKKP